MVAGGVLAQAVRGDVDRDTAVRTASVAMAGLEVGVQQRPARERITSPLGLQ